MNYETELTFAKDVAEEAGKIMLRYFRSDDIATEFKADQTPVTIADKTINDVVINKVQQAYPDFGVLGEEASYYPDRQKIWVVDPIDGTMPFSIGMPVSTFSLALVDRTDGQPLVAVTHDPFLNETFSAVKGSGAYMNDRALHVSLDNNFSGACIALSSRSFTSEKFNYKPAQLMQEFRQRGAKIIGFASFVYTANRVASGQLLANIVGETNPWDIAAAALLVQEAGGIVTDLKGDKTRVDVTDYGCIMAANREVLNEFLRHTQI